VAVELVARRCRVRGRVQGVYYRGATARRAAELTVSGSARNLPDGSVEVIAIGAVDRVDALIQWLWIGPSAAHVTAVDVEELPAATEDPPRGFSTG
jgi:acylphosphatase